jgi:hypothetical protein
MSDIKVTLYQCGLCGSLHPWKWDGDCREDRNRYSDALDYCERHDAKVIEIEVRSWAERQAADMDALCLSYDADVEALAEEIGEVPHDTH